MKGKKAELLWEVPVDFSFIDDDCTSLKYLERMCESRAIALRDGKAKDEQGVRKSKRWFGKKKHVGQSNEIRKDIEMQFFKVLAQSLFHLRHKVNSHVRSQLLLPPKDPVQVIFESKSHAEQDIDNVESCDGFKYIDLNVPKEIAEETEIFEPDIKLNPNKDEIEWMG